MMPTNMDMDTNKGNRRYNYTLLETQDTGSDTTILFKHEISIYTKIFMQSINFL